MEEQTNKNRLDTMRPLIPRLWRAELMDRGRISKLPMDRRDLGVTWWCRHLMRSVTWVRDLAVTWCLYTAGWGHGRGQVTASKNGQKRTETSNVVAPCLVPKLYEAV